MTVRNSDVTQRGVWIDHCTMGVEDGAWGHTTPGGRVSGVSPIRYEDCDRYGCKPVVVLDPEDTAVVAQLTKLFMQAEIGDYIGGNADDMQAALRAMLTPPEPERPDEPGTWGVVQAQRSDRDLRDEWVRHPEPHRQWRSSTGAAAAWDDLTAPVVIRAGIDDEPASDETEPAPPPEPKWAQRSTGCAGCAGCDGLLAARQAGEL